MQAGVNVKCAYASTDAAGPATIILSVCCLSKAMAALGG